MVGFQRCINCLEPDIFGQFTLYMNMPIYPSLSGSHLLHCARLTTAPSKGNSSSRRVASCVTLDRRASLAHISSAIVSPRGWTTIQSNLDVFAGVIFQNLLLYARWWQLKYVLIFAPIWGRWTHFDSYFSKGLVQPPTSYGIHHHYTHYQWTPKPWKMKVLNHQYMGYNLSKWRFWVPMVCKYIYISKRKRHGSRKKKLCFSLLLVTLHGDSPRNLSKGLLSFFGDTYFQVND